MPRLLRVSDRHQITLPPSVLKDASVTAGSYLAVEAKGGKIILEPQRIAEDEFSAEDWKLLDKAVKRELRAGRFTEYESLEKAKKHLSDL